MLSLEFSHLYQPVFTTLARYLHFWGGRGRGGSYTATQYYLHLMTQPEYFRGYLMREIFGDIRESLWRDFKDRVDEAGIEDDFEFNETKMSATYKPTGNVLLSKGFKKSSGKQTAKLKSIAGATHVLIEEAEEISEDDFKQLDDSLRTVKGQIQIIQIFNPPSKRHWIWKRWYNLVDTDIKDEEGSSYYRAVPKADKALLSIFSTYLDNIRNLNESFITNLRAYTGEYFHTVVMGRVSEGVRGRIYKGWLPCTDMPGMYYKFYGLDWGFNHPVALVECEAHHNITWIDEKVYERGWSNQQLSDRMDDLGISRSAPIYADCANPKDIKDMQDKGWNIIDAQKPPGSIMSGIRYLKGRDIFVTERSQNIWFENMEYKWRLDQQKQPLDEPADKNNHAMDAIRYAHDDITEAAHGGPALTFHR